MRIAIIGSGISGLMCAHVLAPHHDVVLFESESRLGGHTNTVRVVRDGSDVNVDTGFIVYNERNYPGFSRLLTELDVATQPSDMSFSVSDAMSGVEWAGTSLGGVFAQRQNLGRPRFLRMLIDIARFSRVAHAYMSLPKDPGLTLDQLLDEHKWSPEFRDDYLIPLGAAIWSADPSTFTEFPAATFLRFCENHGLLSYRNRPAWRTVSGGAVHYVDAIAAHLGSRVRLSTPIARVERNAGQVLVSTADGEVLAFDHVIVATHSDQAVRILGPSFGAASSIVAAIRYQPNLATLHTDASVMPKNRAAWASWNYQRRSADQGRAVLTYDMNRLQSITTNDPLLVTLNSVDHIDPTKVIAQYDYAHPVFDDAAIQAQRQHRQACDDKVSLCGAYWGFGFHEDGVQSALRVCDWLGVKW